jgi:hypothetical protein
VAQFPDAAYGWRQLRQPALAERGRANGSQHAVRPHPRTVSEPRAAGRYGAASQPGPRKRLNGRQGAPAALIGDSSPLRLVGAGISRDSRMVSEMSWRRLTVKLLWWSRGGRSSGW